MMIVNKIGRLIVFSFLIVCLMGAYGQDADNYSSPPPRRFRFREIMKSKHMYPPPHHRQPNAEMDDASTNPSLSEVNRIKRIDDRAKYSRLSRKIAHPVVYDPSVEEMRFSKMKSSVPSNPSEIIDSAEFELKAHSGGLPPAPPVAPAPSLSSPSSFHRPSPETLAPFMFLSTDSSVESLQHTKDEKKVKEEQKVEQKHDEKKENAKKENEKKENEKKKVEKDDEKQATEKKNEEAKRDNKEGSKERTTLHETEKETRAKEQEQLSSPPPPIPLLPPAPATSPVPSPSLLPVFTPVSVPVPVPISTVSFDSNSQMQSLLGRLSAMIASEEEKLQLEQKVHTLEEQVRTLSQKSIENV